MNTFLARAAFGLRPVGLGPLGLAGDGFHCAKSGAMAAPTQNSFRVCSEL